MSVATPDKLNPDALLAEVAELRGRAASAEFQGEVLSERLAELEFALEDAWYARIGAQYDAEFSRGGLSRIVRIATVTYLKNPLIRRAVDVQSHYVWGQGVSFRANDPDVQAALDAFVDDPKNQLAFTSLQAQIEAEKNLSVTGNLFGILFADARSGAVQVRTVDFDEVVDIITNPEDALDVWFYKRQWVQRELNTDTGKLEDVSKTAYYPDWGYDRPERPGTIGGAPVVWNAVMFHRRVGSIRQQRFGTPEIYPALDWAIAYNGILEDDATRSKALARFVWKMTTSGGAPGIAAAKQRLATTLASDGQSAERNPAPVAGSTFVGMKNHTDLTPMNLSGATLPPDHARGIFLQTISALGLPETFYGEVSRGAQATAKTMDRPTELKMTTRQRLWSDLYAQLLQWVIDRAIMAPQGRLRGKGGVAQTRTASELVNVNPTATETLDRTVTIVFPPVLEHDVLEQVNAIVAAATLAGNPPAGTLPEDVLVQQLASALGLEDVDEIVEQVAEEREQAQADELAQTKQQLASLQAQQRQQQQSAPPGEPRGKAEPASPQGQEPAPASEAAEIAQVLRGLKRLVERERR